MKRLTVVIVLMALAGAWTAWADAPLPRPLAERVPEYTETLAGFSNAKGCAGVTVLTKGVESQYNADTAMLRVMFPARIKEPGLTLWSASAPKDLGRYDHLRVFVTNPGSARLTLWFTVYDSNDTKQGTRLGIPVDPGAETVVIPLAMTAGGNAIDRSAVKRIDVAMEAQEAPGILLVEAIEAARMFPAVEGLRAFDFGEGDPFPGMTGVDSKTMYTPERGCGLTADQGYGPKQRDWQFGIAGDGLNGQKVPFAVDVPNGSYEVQVIGFGLNWQSIRNHGFTIDAEGANAVTVAIDQDNYYTTDHFLFGYDRIFDPERSVYEQYFKDYFAPQVFQVEVKDGQLNLDFNEMMVCAAWICPVADREAAAAAVEVMRQEEAYYFAKRGMHVVYDLQPGEGACPPPAAQAVGYALFARDFQYRVFPDYEPAADEYLTGLAAFGAPGEYEPAVIGIRPLRPLTNIRLAVSDLNADNGQKIPASAVDVCLAKQVMTSVGGNRYKPAPRLLVPAVPVSAPAYYNRLFWLTVHIPDNAAAGAYHGTVTVTADGGGSTVLPWTVNVYPFDLPPTDVSMGMWDNGVGKHDIAFQWPGRDAYIRKVVRNQIADMVAHGLNGMTLPGPVIKSVNKDGTFTSDWSHLDIIAEEIMRSPMKDSEQIISILGQINYRFMRSGLTEFGPEFQVALKGLLDELMAWKAKHGIKILLQVVDEPRETEINDWNRNRKDTIRYLKMIRGMVPDLRLMVDPMGDNDGLGDSYLCMIPLMDVCMTHSTPNSRQTIFLARDEGLAEYTQYNNGMERFTYGFFVWKDRSLGHWQWVYSWVMGDQHVPFLCDLGSDAVAAGPDGTVRPTLKYEAVREGIDDHRYIRTLEKAIAAAPEGSTAAAEAATFLKTLDMFLPKYPEHLKGQSGDSAGTKYIEDKAKAWYGLWRRQIAEYIIALQAGAAPVKIEEAWTMLPVGVTKDKKTATCIILKPGEQVPTIDADFNDAAWKNVPVNSWFMNFARNTPAEVQTEVQIATDGKKLYFAFRCFEEKVSQMVANYTERDSGQWQDDSVEIFMDTNLDRESYYQVIVNYIGAIQDGDKGPGSMGGVWDADIEVAAKTLREEYRVEVAITLASLGNASVQAGTQWGLNLCRNRKPPLAETSSWTYVGPSFHNPSGFGTLEFADRK